MRIFVDSADLDEIEQWNEHPWVSGFTTNPTLAKGVGVADALEWARKAVALTDKPISIDGPPDVWELGENVWRKSVRLCGSGSRFKLNLTAVCSRGGVPATGLAPSDIISVFCGRIMDTGRDPQSVIDAARTTGAQVLWASVREPYNIVQAEAAGCDIVTVPPPILRKYLEWHGKPLETVAQETIAQFARDAESLRW